MIFNFNNAPTRVEKEVSLTDSIFNYEHPFVCTDAAVFTIKTRESDSYRKLPDISLRILLYRRSVEPYQSKWCLPGGFLNIDETPVDNIRRKIFEKSNVSECYLEQLYTFCELNRDPRARVISVSYLGLINEIESKRFDSETTWFTVGYDSAQRSVFQNDKNSLSEPDFGFDHYHIIQTALERLRSKILYTNIIFNLLPTEFTLTQLQNVYEIILGKKDQAANFRRKIIDLVQGTGRLTSDKGHRPAELYTKR